MNHEMQKKVFRSGHQSKSWSRFWPDTVQNKKAALIIGMNYTKHMVLEASKLPHQDVESMARLLKSVYDFNSTVVLSDKEGTPEELIPTQANIMRELETFIPSNPDSDYFFVYQGHSSKRVVEGYIGEDDRTEEYIIPYDAIDIETNVVDLDKVITDMTLNKYLVASLPKSSQLVALFDACHSTTLLDTKHFNTNQIENTKWSTSISSFFRRIRHCLMPKKQHTSLGRGREIMSRKREDTLLSLPHHRCNSVSTSASWFAGAQRFTVSDGHFYSSGGPMTINQFPQEDSSRRDISTGPIPGLNLLRPEDIHLQREIHKGRGYRLHSGQNDGKTVAVKVFEGHRAQKLSLATAKFNKKVMHPCFLQMVAAASGSSDLSFVVFAGDYQGTVQSIIHVVLLHNLEKSFILGLQTVTALSSGLDYLQNVDYPVLEAASESFVLLLSHMGTVTISFDPEPSTQTRTHFVLDEPDPSNGRTNFSKTIMDLFSEIIQKTFYLPCKAYYKRQRVHGDVFVKNSQVSQESSAVPKGDRGRCLPKHEDPSSVASSSFGNTVCKAIVVGVHGESIQRPWATNDRLSLEGISRKSEAFLRSFLLDPSLERHHGRPEAKTPRRCRSILSSDNSHHTIASHSKTSTCKYQCSCTLNHDASVSQTQSLCGSKWLRISSTGTEPSLCKMKYAQCGDSLPPESSTPTANTPDMGQTRVKRILPNVDVLNSSGPTMVQSVANLLNTDPSPSYREIMEIAMNNIWMSGPT